jgi:hypothetical protein
VSHSFGYIPKNGIAGSYGRSMFSFLSSLQIFFQSGCTSLHFYQRCKRVPFSPHPRQHLLLMVLLGFYDYRICEREMYDHSGTRDSRKEL